MLQGMREEAVMEAFLVPSIWIESQDAQNPRSLEVEREVSNVFLSRKPVFPELGLDVSMLPLSRWRCCLLTYSGKCCAVAMALLRKIL